VTQTFDPNAKPNFGAGVVITDTNQFSGAGFLDSYTFLIKSCTDIQTADDKDKAALGVAIGLGAFAAVIDTVKLALNPLGGLISAGLGWLIEHVSFLREPLDMLMGDPDQIQLLGQEVHSIAEAIRQIGTDQLESLKGDISQWTGDAADAFNKLMQEVAADLETKAHATDIVGYLVHTNMAIISAVRALFRDLITTVLGDIISTMLIALAAAAFTFGLSIVAAVPVIITQAVLTATSMGSKSAAVLAQAARSAGRMDDVVNAMTRGARGAQGARGGGGAHPAPAPPARPGGATPPRPIEGPPAPPPVPPKDTTPPATAPPKPEADTPPPVPPKDDTPPPVPPKDDTPPPVPPKDDTPPPVPPKDPDPAPPPARPDPEAPKPPAPWTKAHETWLRDKMPEAYKAYKFNENWLKTNHPDAFKSLKLWMADSDGAKEMWSWPVKAAQDVAKQMLDIEKTAQNGYTAEQQK
jgi:hypothetical protein